MASESPAALIALKSRLTRIEGRRRPEAVACAPTGHAGIDAALGGGVARGRLHELFAAEPDDGASAAGLAAMLARRLGGAVIWLRTEAAQRHGGMLYAHGLREIGLDPGVLVLGVLADAIDVLRAAADAVRCPEVGVVVIELWRQPAELDLTATRRLALAAETSGVTVLLLRRDAVPTASAAHSRWRVAAAPALPLEANAPGHPALDVQLVRQRGRPDGGRWRVEWDRERAVFRPQPDTPIVAAPALPGAMVPVSLGGPAHAEPRRRRAG